MADKTIALWLTKQLRCWKGFSVTEELSAQTGFDSLQTALACFEGKKKLLEQARLLKSACVVTAQEPLPDDLVTAVQVFLPA